MAAPSSALSRSSSFANCPAIETLVGSGLASRSPFSASCQRHPATTGSRRADRISWRVEERGWVPLTTKSPSSDCSCCLRSSSPRRGIRSHSESAVSMDQLFPWVVTSSSIASVSQFNIRTVASLGLEKGSIKTSAAVQTSMIVSSGRFRTGITCSAVAGSSGSVGACPRCKPRDKFLTLVSAPPRLQDDAQFL